MSQVYEDLSFTEGMDLELLRELIADGVVPEWCDPSYITQEDWEAYHRDMQEQPVEVPTDAELEEMAGSFNLASVPF